MKRSLMVVAGLAAVGLGAAGIFLPLLPTTPLLLLALFCFARSSDRLHRWLLNHRFFRAHLNDYLRYRAVKVSVKICSLVLLWVSLAVSMMLVGKIWIYILLSAIGMGVTIHLLSLKILPKGGKSTESTGAKITAISE